VAEKRRALVVSYHFAPVAGVATERCRKFVKYLPEFGWETSILTQSLEKARVTKPLEIDEGCFDELPKDLKIERVDAPLVGTGTNPSARGAVASTTPDPIRRSFIQKIIGLIRSIVVGAMSPDLFLPWIPFALVAGARTIRRDQCQVIFATGPVFSGLPLAALLSLVTRRPLILDYRDPWGENEALFRDRPIKQRYNRVLERLCLRQSARVVFATEGFRALYAARHPDLLNRFVVIANGYDRDPASISDYGRETGATFRVGYAGKMFGEQYPVEPLFRGLRELVARRGKDAVRFEMAGMIDAMDEALIDELDLGEVVELRGYLKKSEVEALQARSDALLLIIGDKFPFLFGLESAKLFEYMPLRRPIIGLVPDGGAAWKILTQHALGPVASPSDPVSIADALEGLIEGAGQSRSFDPPPAFHRRRLTEELASLMDEVVGQGADGRGRDLSRN
jgi:glycosyltransferase involved in cell wall biosynthesis